MSTTLTNSQIPFSDMNVSSLAQYFTPRSSGNLPYQNQLALNGQLIQYELYGDSILQTNYNLIYDIASQCPLAGGIAVYQARTLIGLLNDSIEYNDDANCLLAGYYRTSSTLTNNMSNELLIIPNPNDGSFILQFEILKSQQGVLRIENILGQNVVEKIVNEVQTQIPISIKSAPGIYLMRLELSDGSIFSKRFIVR